jgi:DNA-directed RNA polymerase
VDVVFLPSGTARRSIVVEHDTDVVAERKAVNAVMPNLIHALDGALLHHVLSAVPRAWSVTIIHDCYGTHATRTGQLHKLLRRHTFELFSQPVLENWLDVMRSSADDPTLLPELPELGSFDPADVLHAPYAFS